MDEIKIGLYFCPAATKPSSVCASGQFRCGSSTICIDDSKVCDVHPDCPHGDDETKCSKYTWRTRDPTVTELISLSKCFQPPVRAREIGSVLNFSVPVRA